jgi:hypothetical protein
MDVEKHPNGSPIKKQLLVVAAFFAPLPIDTSNQIIERLRQLYKLKHVIKL